MKERFLCQVTQDRHVVSIRFLGDCHFVVCLETSWSVFSWLWKERLHANIGILIIYVIDKLFVVSGKILLFCIDFVSTSRWYIYSCQFSQIKIVYVLDWKNVGIQKKWPPPPGIPPPPPKVISSHDHIYIISDVHHLLVKISYMLLGNQEVLNKKASNDCYR